MADYIIEEVRLKNGVMRDIHKEVLGRKCHVIDLVIGQRAWLKYEPEYDPGNFHRLHTSVVENWMADSAEEHVTIETENTVYVLHLKRGDDVDIFG